MKLINRGFLKKQRRAPVAAEHMHPLKNEERDSGLVFSDAVLPSVATDNAFIYFYLFIFFFFFGGGGLKCTYYILFTIYWWMMVMMMVSKFNGTSTPKGSYSAKTGDNDCNVNSRNCTVWEHSLSGQVWTKCPTRPDTHGAPQGGCVQAPLYTGEA